MAQLTDSHTALRKQEALLRQLAALDSLLVAYSGGVDSAYLAWAAHRALGRRALAVTAISASFSAYDRQQAERCLSRQILPGEDRDPELLPGIVAPVIHQAAVAKQGRPLAPGVEPLPLDVEPEHRRVGDDGERRVRLEEACGRRRAEV